MRLRIMMMLAFGVLSFGCDKPRQDPLKGVVLTNSEVSATYLSSRRKTMPGDAPVAGAAIRLFFDAQLKNETKLGTTISEPNGEYIIETKGLSPPTDPYGLYYLVVEKIGFGTLTYPVRLGPFSRDLEHAVYLQQKPTE